MEVTDRITEAWKVINSVSNWEDESFDWNKAYVSSIFSKVAYLHIPEYELKNANRANLIPCEEYREIIKNERVTNLTQILNNSDFGDFFIVERPYAIAIIVKVKEVIFVSMRGTQQLYDWLVNINAMKSRPYPNNDIDIFFHKGFHKAATSCINEIFSEITTRYEEETKIYVTGHSLGGALAAILHGLWNEDPYGNRFFSHKRINNHFRTISCYVFGMPRYGNFHAMEHFASPYHIYNQADIVPTIPSKLFGYEDSLIEYCLNSESEIDHSKVKGSSFTKFIYGLATYKGIKEHDMELYMSRVKKLCNFS
jgi:predicted lipase